MPAECGLTSAATLATREAAELFINCGTDGNLEKLLIFSLQEFLKTHTSLASANNSFSAKERLFTVNSVQL